MSQPTFLSPLVGEGARRFELVDVRRGSVLAARIDPALGVRNQASFVWRRGLKTRRAAACPAARGEKASQAICLQATISLVRARDPAGWISPNARNSVQL